MSKLMKRRPPATCRRLGRRFFRQAPAVVARELLGQRLVHTVEGVRLSGIIVETEAYLGIADRASHSFGGRRTKRNQSMYADGGTAYVFLCYGMHYLFNVVTETRGIPSAVLIRALELDEHRSPPAQLTQNGQARRRCCSGPGKLTEVLKIDQSLDGSDLVTSPHLFIERSRTLPLPPTAVAIGPRVGVDYAGTWAQAPLRFTISGHPSISRPIPGYGKA